ncbi:hypothetical protein [Streptomyces sp. RTd22]|uniref:hypothetical protein n=1 Tax=Streptomyces sp. RTd22 TaxID=1841249 RepID=UPI0007C47C5C|nr:hypothetical protein [Streptomyces sp. RTd22]
MDTDMNGTPPALRPEDEPDVERVLRKALNTPEIRAALRRHGSAGSAATGRLRARVLAERTGIAAAAAPEYAAYLRQRTAKAPDVRTGPAASATAGVRGLLPALAVLAPVLAAAATAVFLLLGSVLGLGGPGRELGDALLTAGQTAAVVTAVTTACGVAWLLSTAAAHRTPAPTSGTPGAAEAREAWRRALLERGVLPYLRAELRRTEPNRTAAPGRRPRLGYSSPDFAGPAYEPYQTTGKEGDSQKKPIQP